MLKNYISKNKSLFYTLCIIAIAIVITAMMYAFKNKADKKAFKKNLVSVSAVKLQKNNNSPKINLFCTIVNPYITKLKSPIETYVDQVLAHPTEHVKEGKILIILNLEELHNDIKLQENKIKSINEQIKFLDKNYEFDNQLLQSEKNKFKIAQKNLKRFEQLQEKLAVSKKQVDDAKFDLESSQLGVINRQKEIDLYPIKKTDLTYQLGQAINQLDNLKLDLKRSTIISPINGYITQVNAAKGSKVEPGQILIELHDNNKTEIRCQIPELYVSQVYKAARSKHITKGYTEIYGETYELKMLNISSIARINQGGADATFLFENKRPPLAIIGKTVKVQITMPAIKDSYLVPLSAIYHDHFIYKIVNEKKISKLKSVKVDILGLNYINGKEYLIIKSPKLYQNETVLMSTLATATEGLPVKVIKYNKIDSAA